ncbi:MAG TPA: hypothetical protein VGL25_02190 [Casimicrobiaceae bacterium]
MEDIKLKTITAAIALAACTSAPVFAGNGLDVNGSHYNLNIVGKDNCAPVPLTGSNRHVIQVLLNFNDGSQNGQAAATLDRKNKIFLSPGDFQVTDGNACDKDGASFTLPAGGYSVWARALAKPGGTATITLCAVDTLGTADPSDDLIVCNTAPDIVSLERKSGQPVFSNVTKELTTLTIGTTTSSLFDAPYYGYFWDYDNNGLRLTQLRFYPN